MKRLQAKRMNRITEGLAATPLRHTVVQRAFDAFRETGELPEQQRLADAVCRRALGGDYARSPIGDPTCVIPAIRITIRTSREWRPPHTPSVRENVFHEAVFCDGIIQRGARALLKLEVGFGADPANPQFLADRTFPDHAGVGLHLLGFPERLAKPPFVAQARRLFARHAELRARIDRYEDDPWFETLKDAILQFQGTGDLPDDELLRDAVLADAEFAVLFQHDRGADVREWMAVLDRAARAKGAKREEAIEAVQEYVRARLRGAQ